jgi:hypothetical protein
VATNRETIEIALSGLEKLNQLERTLKGLETYADNVADAIGGIQSRIDELSGVAGRAATRARSASVAARAIGGVVGDKSFGRGPSGGETLKNRNRLKKIAASVDLELQQSRTVFREAAKARRALTPELEKLGKAANQNAREQAKVGAELTEYRKTVRSARERILAGVSELGAQARGRSTNILRSRYRTQRNRLSSGPELSGELAKQAEELERKFESTEKRLAQLDRAERALNRTVRAANPGASSSELRGIIGRERGAIASSRRATVTEQGRLLEQRREIGRVSRGRRLVGAQGTILRERISELERAGVTPGKLKADVGGQSVDLRTILQQASQAANLAGKKGDIRGNVERAKTLLEIAKNQVAELEREEKLKKKIASEDKKRITEGNRAVAQERRAIRSIEVQQRSIAELAGQGTENLPSFQRAQAAVQSLPRLQRSGNYAEFANALADATTYARFARDDLKARSQVTKRTNKYEGEINKIAADILAGKKVERSQVDKLLKFNELRAGGAPQQLALPPAAPGAPAFGGGARPGLRGAESVIGGVAQPRLVERLGGARTAEEALQALPEKAKNAGRKAGQQAGQSFAKAFAQATPLGVSDKLLSEFGATAKKLPSLIGGAGAAGGRQLDPQAAQQRLARILASGATISGQLGILAQKRSGLDPSDPKRVRVETTLISLQNTLNATKQQGFRLTKDTLDALDGQLNSARLLLTAESDINKLRKDGLAVAKRTGQGRLPSLQRDTLTSGLIELGRADTAAKVFRGGRSGEQALSDAIRAFNAATGPQKPGARVTQKGVPIGREAAAGAAAAGQNVANTLSGAISNGTSNAASSGTKLASAITRAIEKVFDINSPSGWAIGIAKNIIGTLAGNISAGVPTVQSALRDLLRFVDQYSEEGRAAASASVGRSFDFAVKSPTLGANYDALNQAIADLTMNSPLYKKRIESVGLQNMPTQLLGEASARGTLQDLMPELKIERMFKQLPGTLERMLDDAFVKSANKYSSTRFVSSQLSPATAGLAGASPLNPGILFGSAGRLRGKTPRGFSGAGSPIFNAPTSLLDLNPDIWNTQSSFLFGQKPSGRRNPSIMPIFGSTAFTGRTSGQSLGSTSTFSFGNPVDEAAQALERSQQEVQNGENALRASVKNFFAELRSGVNFAREFLGQAGGGGGGGRPPVPPGGAGDFEGQIEGARGNAQRLLGLADLADLSNASNKQLQLFSAALAETRDGLKATDAAFGKINKVLDRTEDALARRDPNSDLLVRGFGRRGGQAVGEGLIGGAFPLLFGQGGGAALGGGLGGALGGFAGGTLGFGLSLAGTAIGSQVDALAQAAQDTGNLLRDLTGNFEQIKDSGLLASRSQEKLVENLLEAGNKTAAYAILQAELNRKIGVEGAAKLIAAADAGDRLKRAMADLGVQMQVFIAGPLAEFLNRMTSILEEWNKSGTVATALGQVSGDKQREALLTTLARENIAAGANPQKSGVNFRRGPLGSVPVGPGAFGATGPDLLKDITSNLSSERVREIVGQFALPKKQQQLTPQQQRQETARAAETGQAAAQRQLDFFSKKNEVPDLLRGFKQQALAAQREQQDLDRQSFELRRDYERQIEDIRRNIEDRINQIRQENQQRELEILVKQGQIREQQFKNASTALQSALAGDPLAQSLADAVTTYLGAQMSAQDQLEQRRKQFEIEISSQQLETEKFKLEVGRTLSRLNTDTAEKVAEINKGVRRKNEDAALNEFKIQKESAKLRAQVIGQELKVMLAKQNQFVQEAQAQYQRFPIPDTKALVESEQRLQQALQNAVSGSAQNIKDIEAVKPPQLLREVSGPAARSVSFAGVNQGIARAKQLREQLQGLEKELLDLVKGGNLELFANQLGEIAFKGFFDLNNSLKNAKQEAALAGGDIGASVRAIVDSYNDLFALAQQTGVNIDAPTRKFIEGIRDGQIAFEKIKPSMEFYASNLQDITNQTKQSRAAIDELLLPAKAYDKVLAQINARGGLGINPEEEQLLLKQARALDELNAKAKVFEGLRDIASSWTDSFAQLNKELLKGGDLLESVQRFAESVADRTLDVVLEFTLRPIQERLFKNMADILGIKAPEDPALQPIRETAVNTKILADKVKKEFAGQTGVSPAQPVAPANAIVPGPAATAAMTGRYMQGNVGPTSTGDHFHVMRRDGSYYGRSDLDKYVEVNGRPLSSGVTVPGGEYGAERSYGPHSGRDYAFRKGASLGLMNGAQWIGNKPGTGVGDRTAFMTPDGKVYEIIHGRFMGSATPMKPVAAPGFQVPGSPLDGKPAPLPGSTILRKLIPAGTAIPMKPGDAGYEQPGPFGTPAPIQQIPFTEQQQPSPVTPAAQGAAEALANLDEVARKAVEGFTGFGESMSEFATKTTDSVTKFQQIVGTGLQAITGIAMGIGGAQMIRRGGAYNTLMGAASIFGSISSITGMFGTGGPLSGLFGGKAPSATASAFMMPQLTGVPGGARALGGPVYEGMDYLVGEQGPEVIRMGANGTVVPADELYVPGLDDEGFSAPPIGRYARRAASNAESSEMQDGDTIYTGNYGRAVPYQRSESTREIERLERVTSNPGELPPIKYETTRVNEYDFVTPEQLEASNVRTAKMARNQTIRELADSLKTRKRLGL